MNLTDKQYSKFSLVKEMMATADVVRRFDPTVSTPIAEAVKSNQHLFITGEGSSRISMNIFNWCVAGHC